MSISNSVRFPACETSTPLAPHELLNGLRYNDIRELRLGFTATGLHAQVNGGAWQPIGQRLPVDAATGELLTARSVM